MFVVVYTILKFLNFGFCHLSKIDIMQLKRYVNYWLKIGVICFNVHKTRKIKVVLLRDFSLLTIL